MIPDPLSKRRLLARIAIAFIVPWLVLAGFRLSGSFLFATELPLWVVLIQTTRSLIGLSIVVVPLVVWFHARLCWRGNYALPAHMSVGAITASLAMLALFVVSEMPGSPVPSFFLLRVFAVTLLFIAVVSALIGAVASWSAWFFAIRPLRVQAGEVLGRFD